MTDPQRASDTRPVSWAILGTGSVARKFALGLSALGGAARVGTVASRDPANARVFVATLGLGRAAETYADAIADEIDAVYIATPPSEHEAHAALAFAAGKPVLIEKPLASDAATAERIAAAAAAAGVCAAEAMWTRFLPLMPALKAWIDSGELGEVRGFHGTFLGAGIPDRKQSIFDPDRGGGALLHRGIYPIALARHFLGPVTAVTAAGRIGDTNVDEEAVVTLTHSSGAISDIRASLRLSGANGATLWGTRATVTIDPPIWRPDTARLSPVAATAGPRPGPRRFEAFRETARGQRLAGLNQGLRRLISRNRTLRAPFLGNGYSHEAQALAEAAAAGKPGCEAMPLAQSIEILKIIDEARRQIAEAGE